MPSDRLEAMTSGDLVGDVDAIQEHGERYAVASFHALASGLLDVIHIAQSIAVVDHSPIPDDVHRLGREVVLHAAEGEVKAVDRPGVVELAAVGDARCHYRSSSMTMVEKRIASPAVVLSSSPTTLSNWPALVMVPTM